jgi:hypothetical protein
MHWRLLFAIPIRIKYGGYREYFTVFLARAPAAVMA